MSTAPVSQYVVRVYSLVVVQAPSDQEAEDLALSLHLEDISRGDAVHYTEIMEKGSSH